MMNNYTYVEAEPQVMLTEVFRWYFTESIPTLGPILLVLAIVFNIGGWTKSTFSLINYFLSHISFMMQLLLFSVLMADVNLENPLLPMLKATFWNTENPMAPLWAYDWLGMVIVAAVCYVCTWRKVDVELGGIGLAYFLVDVLRALTQTRQSALVLFLFSILGALVIGPWLPYQYSWVMAGYGEQGRLAAGFANVYLGSMTAQVILCYFIVMPFAARRLHERYSRPLAILLTSFFTCAFFAHVAFAACALIVALCV